MRFNFLTKRKQQTVNHENALAWKMGPAAELYATVVTSSLSDTFYEATDERLSRLRTLIALNEPQFVARLAVYARTQMHLRSIPLVLVVELAKIHRGDNLVSQTIAAVVQRADEITELLAYYQQSNGRKGTKQLNQLSKQVQKGLALAFTKFDEYQFAKYNRPAAVKLRDALFLVHPKSQSESQQALYDKIATNALATPYTWETELSALGQQEFTSDLHRKAVFAQAWEQLIESRRLGYMATMRNLRNMVEAGVSARHIEMVCAYLSNATAVANSRQLPFRFLSAYRELLGVQSIYTSHLLQALEGAVQHSAANLPGFTDSRVVVACDVSASMQQPVSARSKVLLYDVGLMLGMLLQSRCRYVLSGMFGDRWKVVNLPRKSVLGNVQEFYRREGEVGYSTNGYLVIRDLLKRKVVADKVMVFTDCQLWNSTYTLGGHIAEEWRKYKKFAPGAKLYLFDLAGYGQSPINLQQNDVFLVAGWSDKVFDMLDALEKGGSAIATINAIEL
jgi:hypothetical protein